MSNKLLKLATGLLFTSNFIFANPTTEVVLSSEVKWTHLNPKRGDLAPKAGTLWGDRNGPGPTGYLLKPNDGFQSPPHIHNVSYRAVVIEGLIHNDDPGAAKMWMTPGSYWTQPKGEIHVTASKGKNALAYIEIENGPYLVFPSKKKFEDGHEAVNVVSDNIVWLDSNTSQWIDHKANGVEISYLWGTHKTDQLNGSFVKLPSGFKGTLTAKGNDLKAIVVKGQPNYSNSSNKPTSLETGSYFSSSKVNTKHKIASKTTGETILYIRSKGTYTILSD